MLNNKLAIIFKAIKVFNRLIKQVFVANPNNYCLPHYFLCMTCHMSGKGGAEILHKCFDKSHGKKGIKTGIKKRCVIFERPSLTITQSSFSS